jgi:hypothetical protein
LHDRDYLEVSEVTPAGCPFLKQQWIVALHQLETNIQRRRDPRVDVDETFRQQAPAHTHRVENLGQIAWLESLDNHEQISRFPHLRDFVAQCER